MNAADRPDKPTPAESARSWLRRAVDDLVAAAGPDAFTDRPIFPGAASMVRKPRPLPAARAAQMIADAAAAAARAHARAARGEGASWADIAAGLGFDRLDADTLGARSPAEYAFEWAVDADTARSWSWSTPTASWDCSTCGQWVTDRGPYNPHPDDQEDGHAPGCARHAADLAAWRARYGD